jgi:hypothetical protein
VFIISFQPGFFYVFQSYTQLCTKKIQSFKMKVSNYASIVGLTYLFLTPALAFSGYGIEMYSPMCAFSCRGAIASAMLSCSDTSAHGGHLHGEDAMTTPECGAGDTSFLTTLAWCMNSTCAHLQIETWRLEKYWRDKTTEDLAVVPKWGYTEALDQITQPPEQEFGEEDTLNFTAIVPYHSWISQKCTMEQFELAETLHSRYGYAVLASNCERT